MSALTLLALCGIGPRDPWSEAGRKSVTVTKGIMTFVAGRYRRKYAPNTRETFRRQVLHQFVQAHVADYNPDDPSLPTNSPRAHYAVTAAALEAIRSYGTRKWAPACKRFRSQQGVLLDVYRKERSAKLVPVRLPDGRVLRLSPGRHNVVQAAVIEKFAPRFAPGAKVLYLGDTAQKDMVVDKETLGEFGVPLNKHDKLPDVVIHDTKRNWLFLIEAVTSHGPMSPKRVVELRKVFARCPVGLVFVSAFPDFSEFRKYLNEIAWETEVWVAQIPDHLIHYNGDKLLGPR
jgi:hypothetical protein